MNHVPHKTIVNLNWGIADDVLRDVYVRSKYFAVVKFMAELAQALVGVSSATVNRWENGKFALYDELEVQINTSAHNAEPLSAAILHELFDQNGRES